MYLVDGNNVIGQRVGWHRDKPGARHQLIEDLVRFIRHRNASLAVVFDGAAEKTLPDGSNYHGLKIYYARPGSNADARIVELVEAERNRKNLIVVTSDRNLTARVRVCGVQVMRSGSFRRMIDQSNEPQLAENEPPMNDEEIIRYMRYFGVDKKDEKDD
ncbi:MAG: NYN domain-containing protein [Acidobacteria bacterium]|nr:NYN domain-containing protein [Acidobacteriota bacterium]